jgi:cytochrome P450
MNFIDDFAALIPARVISAILGLPAGDIPEFTRRIYSLARSLSSSFTQADVPELQTSARELSRYAGGLLEARRREPRDDFLTTCIGAIDAANELSNVEIVMQVITVILGGSDTTRGAGAIQTSLLLRFDIRRNDHPRRHLIFGAGSHRCLGEALAKAELEEQLAALTSRIPQLQLQLAGDPPIIRGNGGIRSVRNMRVRWDR